MITPGTTIDASRARYPTSIEAIKSTGLVDTPRDKNPTLIWIDGILTASEAETLLPFQRVNKIPGMDFLCYKSTLFSELNEMRQAFPSYFEFYPHTYLLPLDFPEFQREHSFICGRTATAPTWVIKPKSGCCGKGIQFLQTIQEVEAVNYQSVAQLLVKPFLLEEKKFDFRFFILISNLDPYTVLIYDEGIARFCTQNYVVPNRANLDKPFSLLTNTAINKVSDADPSAFTKPASEVLNMVIQERPASANIWEEICDVARMTMIGIFPSIAAVLPMNGGHAMKANLSEVANPIITIPKINGQPSWMKQKFPFLGAPRRIKTKRKKSKKNAKLSEMEVTVKEKKEKKKEKLKQIAKICKPKARSPSPKHKKLTHDVKKGNIIVKTQADAEQVEIEPVLSGSESTRIRLEVEELPPPEAPELVKDEIPVDEEETEEQQIDNELDEPIENKSFETPIPSDHALNESKKSEKPEKDKLNAAQHYFHILGIDIIIDSKGHPKLLELNDRPSLQVTAPFELELKEGLIKEAFTHISLDGSTIGDHEGSKWHQILPVPQDHPMYGPINSMKRHQSTLKYSGKLGANSPGTQRMMASGIKPDIHDIKRGRFFKIDAKEQAALNNSLSIAGKAPSENDVNILCE